MWVKMNFNLSVHRIIRHDNCVMLFECYKIISRYIVVLSENVCILLNSIGNYGDSVQDTYANFGNKALW